MGPPHGDTAFLPKNFKRPVSPLSPISRVSEFEDVQPTNPRDSATCKSQPIRGGGFLGDSLCGKRKPLFGNSIIDDVLFHPRNNSPLENFRIMTGVCGLGSIPSLIYPIIMLRIFGIFSEESLNLYNIEEHSLDFHQLNSNFILYLSILTHLILDTGGPSLK